MDEQTRRVWSRPELIVLVRSGREEAVLGACKLSNASYKEPTPYLDDQACIQLAGQTVCGAVCSAISES